MKKRLLATVLSLMLVIGLLPTAALAAETTGTFAARIGVTENNALQYNGQNTLEIGFYVQSDNMTIRAVQSALIAIDLEVLEMIDTDGNPLTMPLPSHGAPTELKGYADYSVYKDPVTRQTWDPYIYGGKSVDGNTGYFLFQPTLGSMNASSCVNEIKLMSTVVGFKAGKTKADLTKDSVRFAEVAVADGYAQSEVFLINDGNLINMQMGKIDGSADTFVIPPVLDMGNLVSAGPVAPTGVTLSASSTSVTVGAEVIFTANATVSDNGTLTYTLKNEDGIVAAAQTGKTFKVTPNAAGTKNYYVTATNTLSGKTATADSAKVAVTATAAPVGGSAQLLTLVQESENMLRQTVGNKHGFAPAVTDYQLFFAAGVAPNFKITTAVVGTATTQYSLDGGATYTPYTKSFDVTGTPTQVWIKVSETGKTDSVYKIALVQRTEEDPKVTFNLTNVGQGISKLALTGFENADLTNFTLVLNLNDANTFTGFCDKDGNPLTGTTSNPFELDNGGSSFMVSHFTASETNLTIYFTMGPGDNGFVDAATLGMNIYLLQKDPANPAMPYVAVDTIRSATTSEVELFGHDSKKWADDGRNDETTSLIYLMADKPDYTLDMFFNKAGNNKEINAFTYTIKEKSAVDNLVTNQPLSELMGQLSTNLNNGTYTITVKGGGYVTYTKEVTIAGMSQAIPAVMLLGGDLDGNGTIDNTDMLKLLDPAFYNKAVGGAVTAAYDFNGDGQVDILDLGVLVRNMGASY